MSYESQLGATGKQIDVKISADATNFAAAQAQVAALMAQVATLQAASQGPFPKGQTLTGIALGPDLGLADGLAAKMLTAYGTWWGHKVKIATDYLYDDLGTGRMSQYAGTDALMVWSVQGCPKGSNLANVIAGQHDAAYRQIAVDGVKHGFAKSVYRLNWEADGNWMPGGVALAPNTPEQFAPAYRHVVDIWRSVPGWEGLLEFNCGGFNGLDPATIYPGAAYNDVVACDPYDSGAYSWFTDANGHVYTAADHVDMWAKEIQPRLDATYALAQIHGKPVAFSEWGPMIRSDGHGGGDDDYYMTQFANWCKGKWVAYRTIFNGQDHNATTGALENDCRMAAWNAAAGAFVDSARFPKATAVWKSALYA